VTGGIRLSAADVLIAVPEKTGTVNRQPFVKFKLETDIRHCSSGYHNCSRYRINKQYPEKSAAGGESCGNAGAVGQRGRHGYNCGADAVAYTNPDAYTVSDAYTAGCEFYSSKQGRLYII
jgi:hypothetical protein